MLMFWGKFVVQRHSTFHCQKVIVNTDISFFLQTNSARKMLRSYVRYHSPNSRRWFKKMHCDLIPVMYPPSWPWVRWISTCSFEITWAPLHPLPLHNPVQPWWIWQSPSSAHAQWRPRFDPLYIGQTGPDWCEDFRRKLRGPVTTSNITCLC